MFASRYSIYCQADISRTGVNITTQGNYLTHTHTHIYTIINISYNFLIYIYTLILSYRLPQTFRMSEFHSEIHTKILHKFL